MREKVNSVYCNNKNRLHVYNIYTDTKVLNLVGIHVRKEVYYNYITIVNTPPQVQGGMAGNNLSLDSNSEKRPGGCALVSMSAV